ncbi:MAG TPA: hypothetical protein VGN88_07105 [Phycisphaerae bacterium]
MHTSRKHFHSRSFNLPRGLTFIELLIGLSITAVTCAILAVLINATAMGTNIQNDGRRNLVRLQTLKSILQDEFVNARCILATGSNYVVYWTGDKPGAVTPVNRAVNFTELRLLEIDGSGNLNIYCSKWPVGTTNAFILANDTLYSSATDWYATAEALKGTTYYTTNTIATGATLMNVSLDSGSPTAARMIQVRIDVNDGTVSRQFILAVTLSNPQAPW